MADDKVKLRVEADASQAKKELGGLDASFKKAEESVASFATKAESGGKGVAKAAGLASLELDKLQAEIAQLKATGADVSSLEAQFAKLEARQRSATAAAGKFKDAQEDAARAIKASATGADFGLEGLAAKYTKLLEVMGKVFVVAQAVGAAAQGVAKAWDGIARATGNASEGTSDMTRELNELGQSISSLDLIGVVQNLSDFAGQAAFGASATNELADATKKWQESLSGATGRLLRVLDAQKKFVADLAEERQARDDNVKAILRQVAVEQQSGAVQKATRERIQDLLDAYDELGDPVDGKIAAVAKSLGIMSSEQERAAKAAEDASTREQSAAEAAAAKEEERATREQAAAEARAKASEDAAKRKEEASKKEIAAIEASVKAAQDAYDAEVARNQGEEGGESELEALRKKVTLTEEEKERLDELTKAHYSTATAQEKRRKVTEAQRREDEAYAKVEAERLRLEQALSDRLTQSLDDSQARRDAAYDEAEAAKYRVQGAQDLYNMEEKLAERFVKNGELTREQADAYLKFSAEQKNAALAAEALTKQADGTAEALGKLGETTKETDDGMKSFGDAAVRSAEALQEIKAILPEIITLAAQVRLGGAG